MRRVLPERPTASSGWMCYPSDHPNGEFIPNFVMWFVLELKEYLERTGDTEMVLRARERVYNALAYFARFENRYGLLEHLESWIFIEWSRANDEELVRDVNFPTNMLYARMLRDAGLLYHDDALLEKADRLSSVIRERSFNGTWFTDNEVPDGEGGYRNPGNSTEICQYLAFYMGIADPSSHRELWETLIRDFGAKRKEAGAYPEVAPANTFMGDYIRVDMLSEAGLHEEVLRNIRAFFEKMADETGTLWEMDTPTASCNHGFASHVLCWLAKARDAVKES